ncbi:MAG TPA: ribonuclease III [Bacteroidia bacterium]|nr:ribonuclease III [Bacteroidia bacterium]
MLKVFSIKRYTNSSDKKLAQSIKNLFGFKATNLDLFKQALRHSSAAKNKTSNERLEFLGDSVLNALIAEYLFKLMPNAEEGILTQSRSRIVSRQNLNKLALKMGIDSLLVTDIRGHLPGSVFGNALEALVGAVFLDQGYKKTQKIILEKIIKQHLQVEILINEDTDYKSRLINHYQKLKIPLKFLLISEEHDGKKKIYHVGVEVNEKILAEAKHPSKRAAEQLAAMTVLEKIEEN